MQSIRNCIFAIALALGITPGQAADLQKLRIVATTTDLKSLAEAVGGKHVDVESIAAPNQDPHSIELKPTQIARLRKASLVIRIGLDHEPWLARAQSKVRMVDASRGVRLLQTATPRLRAERHSHVHAFGNPHYWLDPENSRAITAAIVEEFSRLQPQSRTEFEANRNHFLEQLDSRMQAWKQALAPYRGTKAVVMHDSWSYFADRFGLSILAAAEPTPGVPPSPTELAKLFSRMREAKVRAIIADPHSSPSLVRYVSEHGGAPAVVLVPSVGAEPGVNDYLSLFDVNIQRLLMVLQ
jgi:ABC-type Zn uptake system ZnuABC Zn-binding protein ZnuA